MTGHPNRETLKNSFHGRNIPDGETMWSNAMAYNTQLSRKNVAVPLAAVSYQSGFGNQFQSEAVPGALPIGRNSPQRAPLGLYAEQISGTAFTAARHENRRTWTYRIWPSVVHRPYRRIDNGRLRTGPFN